MALTRIQTIYVPAARVAECAAFYERILAARPRFRDGDRWVQFGVGGVGFAVASFEESAPGAAGAVSVFESDDPADHALLMQAGAEEVSARDMGDHGRTRTYLDPAGNLLQLFWRAP